MACWFGDGGLDAASSQVSADLVVRVGLVGKDPAGSGAGLAGSDPGYAQSIHERAEGHRVMPLPRGGHPRQRAAPAVGDQMNLGAQTAAGAAQRFSIGSPSAGGESL
jgi:hypothetical protein